MRANARLTSDAFGHVLFLLHYCAKLPYLPSEFTSSAAGCLVWRRQVVRLPRWVVLMLHCIVVSCRRCPYRPLVCWNVLNCGSCPHILLGRCIVLDRR